MTASTAEISSGVASTERLSLPAVLSAFAPFMIGAFAIIEMLAYWTFGGQAGWPGFVGAAFIAAALTFYFRDRLKKKI